MRFGLRSLLVLTSLVALICALPTFVSRINLFRLSRFVEQDLTTLSAQDSVEFEGVSNAFLRYPEPTGYSPLRLWRHPKGHFALLERRNVLANAGYSSARLTLIGNDGRIPKFFEVEAGQEINIIDARLVPSGSRDALVFQLETRPTYGGRNIARMYFAVFENRLCFLKAEKPNGDDFHLTRRMLQYAGYDLLDRVALVRMKETIPLLAE